MSMKMYENIGVGLERIDQPSTRYLFSIRHILEKKWEYNNEVCQQFRALETTYNSIERESLYDIRIKFGEQKK